MMAFCMGTCVKLYGKCEECIMRRLGKGAGADSRLPSSKSCEQVVVITHQPIGGRPRLVSDHDLFATATNATTTTTAVTTTVASPTSPTPPTTTTTITVQSPSTAAKSIPQHFLLSQSAAGGAMTSRSASFRWKRHSFREKDAAAAVVAKVPSAIAAANIDEEAEACSPMLTKSEQIQPNLGNDGKPRPVSQEVPSTKSSASRMRSDTSTLSGELASEAAGTMSPSASMLSGSDSAADFDYCQSLRFAMLYQPGNARLQVTIKSFCVLPPTLTAGCYVVVSLVNCVAATAFEGRRASLTSRLLAPQPSAGVEITEKLVASYKTTIKQKTKIPEWEETFVIDNVQRPSGEGETLIRLEVIAFDQFSREICIGRLKVDVASLKDCITQEFFRTLDEDQQLQLEHQLYECSLLVGLFYHHTTQTLVLDMIKVKDLTSVASQLSSGAAFAAATGGSSSGGSTSSATALPPSAPSTLKHMVYFVRARIYDGTQLIKERRTTERKVTDEVLNESLTFSLDKRNIRNVTAEFTMFIRSRKEERQLGWFSLGATPSGQVEKEHWANMLRSHASPVVQWLHFKQPSSPMCSPMLGD